MNFTDTIQAVVPMDKMPVVSKSGLAELELAIAYVASGANLYFLTINPHSNEFSYSPINYLRLASPTEQIESQERINKERASALGSRGKLVVPQQEIVVPNR